ncbi:MAG TPA: serine/threonine-protein kinase [Acidimicrobiales bacterium]|nr:serine/threonine-protein kinase [Acidimicrobiales bacterium]
MSGTAVDNDLLGGRYRLLAPLGSGGMATVFRGRDERLDRSVAIKLLRPDLARDPALRRRFELEARAAARLSHPNVVAVYDAGDDGGRSFIVMECLRGESLADVIRHGPVDQDWLRRLAVEVLSALGAAHAAGIIHRDVKPGNILLGPDGRAKVSDFGIASVAEWRSPAGDGDHTAAALTGAGLVLGTVAYLAPERAMGAPATPQSDLYSLGVVLYEALTGSKPYNGNTPAAIATAAVHHAAQDPRARRPDADADLVATIGRAMNPDPALRYPTDAAMAADLRRPAPAATDVLPAAAVAAFAATEALASAEPETDPRGAEGAPAAAGFVGAAAGFVGAPAGFVDAPRGFAGVPAGAAAGFVDAPGGFAGVPAVAAPAGVAAPAALDPDPLAPTDVAATRRRPPALLSPGRRPPWLEDRRWLAAAAAVGVIALIVMVLALAKSGSPSSASTTSTTAGHAATTAAPTSVSTHPTDSTALALEAIANQLRGSDSAQASALAAGLDNVASIPAGSARTSAASALLTQATQWYQQGQLTYTDYIRAAAVLQQAGAPQALSSSQTTTPARASAPGPARPAKHGGHGKGIA